MNNLIINGVDHSVFDLEWAKRGGVLVSLESENTRINVFKFLRSVTAEKIEVSTMSQLCFVTNFYEYRRVFRMATPNECAEAGIEYIEPPMIWRDIESAPNNKLILLLQHTLSYGDCIYSGAYVDGEWLDYTGKVHNSPHLWMPRPQPPKDE